MHNLLKIKHMCHHTTIIWLQPARGKAHANYLLQRSVRTLASFDTYPMLIHSVDFIYGSSQRAHPVTPAPSSHIPDLILSLDDINAMN